MGLAILICVFLLLMIIGVPIAYNLIISTFVYLLASGAYLPVLAQKMFDGMNSFSFLAIPFFVITGELMLKGGLLQSLIDFVNAFFGRFSGAVAMVTIGAALLMGAIVGLAVAAAAALGVFLIPMMKREGYAPAFSSAVMSSASLLGPIMPPSVLMILYCTCVGSTSIAGIFLAAIVPAIMIAGFQIIIANRISAKRGYKAHEDIPWSEKWRIAVKALPALFMPVLILGGIFGGIFSITEASAVAALYSAVLAFVVKKSVTIRDIPIIIREAARTTGLTLLLAGAGSAMAWAIANERVLSSLVGPLSTMSPWLFLLIINAILIVVGCFMDDYASTVIFAPIIAPIAWAMGIDPLHIGVVVCVNLVVGLATPPFGITLFITSPIAGVTVEQTTREAIPFLAATIGVLLLITFVPEICLFLPRLAGY